MQGKLDTREPFLDIVKIGASKQKTCQRLQTMPNARSPCCLQGRCITCITEMQPYMQPSSPATEAIATVLNAVVKDSSITSRVYHHGRMMKHGSPVATGIREMPLIRDHSDWWVVNQGMS